MDTTLPLPFLPSVELGQVSTDSKQGLQRTQLSYLGCVHFTATNSTIGTVLQFLQRHISIEAYVDIREVASTEDVVSILDGGARKVFATTAQLESLNAFGDRVIPIFSAQDNSPPLTAYSNGVLLDMKDLSAPIRVLERLVASKVAPIFLKPTKIDLQAFIEVATEYSTVPIVPATNLTFEKGSADQISVSELLAASWTSDRADKLIPTLVTDERGIALGLVYSSRESFAESLKSGTGVYQSRKRGLWYKGATSGDTQELVRVSLDCDLDCLRFTVRQQGRGQCKPQRPRELNLTGKRVLSFASINMFWRSSRDV